MQRLADQIIIDVLKDEMSLEDDQIWIRDQNRKIPDDQRLYVVVGMSDAIPMSTQNYLETRDVLGDPVTFAITRANMRENIQIDILSRSPEAVVRRTEVLMALTSITAKQAEDANYFKIGKLPTSFVNSSLAEGGSQINRYSLVFACLVWYKNEKQLTETSEKWYDDFDTRVDDEITIGTPEGIIEFNIKAEV